MNTQITPQDLNLPEYKGFIQDIKLEKGGKKKDTVVTGQMPR